MHVTIRKYDGIDQNRKDELTKKVGESLLPRLSKSDGFRGYFLMETKEGVMSSIGFFDTMTQAEESSRVAASWVREEKLESLLPNAPKVTDGEVVVKEIVEKTPVLA
jgi:hypothetical protein